MFDLPIFIGEVVFVSFRNDEAAVIMKALKELTEKIATINFKKEAFHICRISSGDLGITSISFVAAFRP